MRLKPFLIFLLLSTSAQAFQCAAPTPGGSTKEFFFRYDMGLDLEPIVAAPVEGDIDDWVNWIVNSCSSYYGGVLGSTCQSIASSTAQISCGPAGAMPTARPLYFNYAKIDLKTGISDVSGFSMLSQLAELNFMSTSVSDTSMLPTVQGLKKVTFSSNSGLVEHSASLLSGAETGGSLTFTGNSNLERMSGENAATNLQTVTFSNNAKLKEITGLNSLVSVSTIQTYGNNQLHTINGFQNLETVQHYLRIGFYNQGSAALSTVNFPKLSHVGVELDLRSNSPSFTSLNGFSALRTAGTINLARNSNNALYSFYINDISALGGITSLTKLEVYPGKNYTGKIDGGSYICQNFDTKVEAVIYNSTNPKRVASAAVKSNVCTY